MHGDHDHDHDHDHEHGAVGAGGHHHHGHGEAGAGQHHHHHDEAPHTHGPVPEQGHEGSHVHDDAPRPPPLKEGEGRGKTLFFDAFSGIAGDMTIAALLDLGVPLLVVERALAALPLGGYHLHRGHAHRSAIVATTFEVHVEGSQPLRTWSTIDAMLAASTLEPAVRERARAIFHRLGVAEARVLRTRLEDVHFHEVGAVDAIVDIVGAAAALTWLGADVVCAPLPMGRGFVRAAHGPLPNPAPAVVTCLEGCPTYEVPLDAELVTPTGAAIAATVATRFARWPTMAPLRVGFGAGRRELPDRPNVLRLVLGDVAVASATPEESTSATPVVLEANVDDKTGEVAGYAIDALLAAGALDAWAVPATMKKGRPGLVVSALCDVARAEAVTAALLRETTSIGVRRVPVTRTERPRRMATVETSYGPIAVKISEGPFGPPQVKPEFEPCAEAARRAGVPVREVIAEATAAARRARP